MEENWCLKYVQLRIYLYTVYKWSSLDQMLRVRLCCHSCTELDYTIRVVKNIFFWLKETTVLYCLILLGDRRCRWVFTIHPAVIGFQKLIFFSHFTTTQNFEIVHRVFHLEYSSQNFIKIVEKKVLCISHLLPEKWLLWLQF